MQKLYQTIYLYIVFDADLKTEKFPFENLSEMIVCRFRECMEIITTDWTSKTASRDLLNKNFLQLTPNALADGEWCNAYVTVREGMPYLTNNLTKVPKNPVKKRTLVNILSSRIVQCKYLSVFEIKQLLPAKNIAYLFSYDC